MCVYGVYIEYVYISMNISMCVCLYVSVVSARVCVCVCVRVSMEVNLDLCRCLFVSILFVLSGKGPNDLSYIFHHYTPARPLRPVENNLLVMPTVRTKHVDVLCFLLLFSFLYAISAFFLLFYFSIFL